MNEQDYKSFLPPVLSTIQFFKVTETIYDNERQ